MTALFAVITWFGLRGLIGLAAGASLSSILWMGWDAAVDDPAIRRAARDGYVREAELAGAQARAEQSERLRQAAEAKAAEMEAARRAYEAALAQARQELAAADLQQQDLEDALDELRRARPADRRVPTVRDLVGDRLRN